MFVCHPSRSLPKDGKQKDWIEPTPPDPSLKIGTGLAGARRPSIAGKLEGGIGRGAENFHFQKIKKHSAAFILREGSGGQISKTSSSKIATGRREKMRRPVAIRLRQINIRRLHRSQTSSNRRPTRLRFARDRLLRRLRRRLLGVSSAPVFVNLGWPNVRTYCHYPIKLHN